MPSEAKRGLQRIIANYIRLLSWLALGLILLPFLIRWVGLEGYGLISLIGATLGFAGIFQQLMNQSLIREIGSAYHSEEDGYFQRVYNASFVIAALMAALSALVFVVLFALIRVLNIPEELVVPARWFVAAQGVYSVLLVMLSPAFSLYRVLEKFGWYAFWMICIRGTGLASAALLALVFHLDDLPQAITWYGIVWSGMLCVVMFAGVVTVVSWDRRFLPNPGHVRRKEIGEVLHTFGWNSAVHVAMNLHERLAAVLMNLAFGLFGNAVFNVSLQLVSYVRMLTTGVTFGLDAASARIASNSPGEALREFMRHASRLQAFIALPAGLAMFFYAEPVLWLWIGSSLEDPETMIPAAVLIIQILTFGLAARAIADGWMFILYGAGFVRRYAPMVLTGGFVSPTLGALLLVLMPDPIRFYAPAIGFALVIVAVHFFGIPVVVARCLEMRYRELFLPLIRPLLVTTLCAPILVWPALAWDLRSIPMVIAPCATFGVVYAVLSWCFVLSRSEKARFGGSIQRRLNRSRASAPSLNPERDRS